MTLSRELSNQSSLQTRLALFFTILGIYMLFSPAHFLTTPDEELNLRTTLSLVQGYKGAIPPLPGGFASAQGIDGNEYAQYGLGLPLAYAAWTRLGIWIDPSADTSPNHLENITPLTQAGTPFLRAWITIFSMLITTGSAVIFHWILSAMNFPYRRALFFSLLFALGTYAFPHGRTLFSEPLVALCLLASIACLLRSRRFPADPKWLFYAGLLWAYAVLTRLDTLVTLPAAAWFVLMDGQDQKLRLRINPVEIALFSIPFVAAFITIGLYNQYRFDSFFSTGYEDQAEKIHFITPLLVGLHGFLFTPGRSIFMYSPPLIFTFFGIPCLWRRSRWLCGGLLILCGLFLAVMSKWQNWSGGYDWGPRHIYQLTPFFMLFAVFFFDQKPAFNTYAKTAGWIFLALLSFLIQFLGLAADPVQAIRGLLYAWNNTAIAPGFSYWQV